MSGSFEPVRRNACVHGLDLGLSSRPKEFSEPNTSNCLGRSLSEIHSACCWDVKQSRNKQSRDVPTGPPAGEVDAAIEGCASVEETYVNAVVENPRGVVTWL